MVEWFIRIFFQIIIIIFTLLINSEGTIQGVLYRQHCRQKKELLKYFHFVQI